MHRTVGIGWLMCLLVGLLAGASGARAAAVSLDVALDRSTLAAGERQTAYLRIALTGKADTGIAYRAPLNVALVIDRSGSMAGRKIEQAKRAALAALDRMGPDDIVSVVAYDTTATVLVPATKVSDRETIERGIRRLRADGSTALFAGTVKGAREVRKFKSRDRVNRVVLLSDGIANVGPSSPGELAELGARLREEGIGVSTVGLGVDYNGDLMVALARSSGALFTFVEEEADLERLFETGFGGMKSIVATDLRVEIRFAEGFRPLRCFGRDAVVLDDRVTIGVAQLYGAGPEEILCSFETSALTESSRKVAEVDVRYHWLPTDSEETSRAAAAAEFSSNRERVEGSVNPVVRVSVVQRLADEEAVAAMRLREEGRVEEALRALESAQDKVDEAARRYRDERLLRQSRDLQEDQDSLADPARWKRQEKHMGRRSLRQLSDDFL